MQGAKFDIVFRGKLAAGFEEATVRANLARMFKKDVARIAPLFSGGRTVLKRGLDRATADKYRKAFRDAGAVVAIVQDRKQAEIKPEPPPTPPDFGREVKAAYAGKATFSVDEGTPPTQDKAAFAVDESAESEAAPDHSEQASSDDQVEALEMPGVAPPPADMDDSDRTQDPQDQADASSAVADIDTSSLSLVGDSPVEISEVGEIPVETGEGRASYVIDESPTELDEGPTDKGGGVASFVIDDGEPKEPEAEHGVESIEDDFAPLDMSSPVAAEDTLLEINEQSPPAVSDAELSEPGSQLTQPVHQDPPDIDISSLTMSEVGVTVDETERPPPVAIDTGDLATEEDFEALDEAPPVPAPDIDTGDMDIMEVGATVDESERPPPLEIDTSGLSTDTDYEGLDEAEKPAEPDIDISQLGLDDD